MLRRIQRTKANHNCMYNSTEDMIRNEIDVRDLFVYRIQHLGQWYLRWEPLESFATMGEATG
jgi:hypothetical protein